MALSATEKDALEQLAKDLEVVASWHTGGREVHVSGLAGKARQIADGGATELMAAATEEAKRQEEIEAARAKVEEAQAAAELAAKGKQDSSEDGSQDNPG